MSEHHIVPLKTYMLIFAALLVGTVITVAIAFVDLGFLNTPVAILIAMVKATLKHLVFHARKIQPEDSRSFCFCRLLAYHHVLYDNARLLYTGDGTNLSPYPS